MAIWPRLIEKIDTGAAICHRSNRCEVASHDSHTTQRDQCKRSVEEQHVRAHSPSQGGAWPTEHRVTAPRCVHSFWHLNRVTRAMICR